MSGECGSSQNHKKFFLKRDWTKSLIKSLKNGRSESFSALQARKTHGRTRPGYAAKNSASTVAATVQTGACFIASHPQLVAEQHCHDR
jgi:hypothetical protein